MQGSKKIIVTPQAMVVDERIFQGILEMNWMLTQNIPLQDMQTFYRVAEQMLHNLEQEEHKNEIMKGECE